MSEDVKVEEKEEVKLSSGNFIDSLILGQNKPRATISNPILSLVESFMT